MKAFAWIEPESIDAAIAAGAEHGALFKAGAVDVADRLKEHLEEPVSLVNLRGLKELVFVREDTGVLSLGPLVTLHALAEDSRVRARAPALAQAAGLVATPQIRAMATLGGNLVQRPRCAYFRSELFPCLRKGGATCFAQAGENERHAIFDNDRCAVVHPSGTATALLALNAVLVVRGPRGTRPVPIDAFFVSPKVDVTRETVLAPGELIAEVRVPFGPHSAYVKIMQKESFDWPLADAAASLELEGRTVRGARLALGHVAPTPRRAYEAEAALVGRAVDDASARAAAKTALAGATPMRDNRYKVRVAEAAARRALMAAGGAS